MGKFRAAFESELPLDRRSEWHYGPPASVDQITAAEADLNLPIPAPLRELYQEFDGLRREGNGDQLSSFLLLPLSRLSKARDILVKCHAGVHNLEEISRCVAFAMPAGITTFWFMTDLAAWGISKNRVGTWDQDGGEVGESEPLEEFLVHIGWEWMEHSP